MNEDQLNTALDQAGQQPDAGSMLVVMVIYLGLIALMTASMWRLFSKAGQPGWTSLIPIYNLVVWMRVIQKPMWWVVAMFIPLVNLYFAVATMLATAKAFGKGVGYGLGLLFLGIIFWPMLAFGSAKYVLGAPEPQPQMKMAA